MWALHMQMMVRPKKRVKDYRTHVTGLTAADLQVQILIPRIMAAPVCRLPQSP
jgi:DNA polymerase III epsilon subunit-like protein